MGPAGWAGCVIADKGRRREDGSVLRAPVLLALLGFLPLALLCWDAELLAPLRAVSIRNGDVSNLSNGFDLNTVRVPL